MPRAWTFASAVIAALALAAVLTPGPALAQGNFRVTYTVDRGPSSIEVAGKVFNDGAADAVDVYVTAEAIDGNGRRVAQGVTWVGPIPGRGGSAAFSAKVPAVRNATAFRVGVSSFRYGSSAQSP